MTTNSFRRYQIEYSLDARRKPRGRHVNRGYCDTMIAAVGNACKHVARSEYSASEYHAAVIIDRKTGKILRRYHRNQHGSIVRTDF